MNWKKLTIVLVLSSFCVLGCKTTPKAPPRIWYGKQGDTVAWEKAKVVMENYDWEVREDLR
jgi:hypothetical protein